MKRPTKQEVKDVIDDLETLNLPVGAFWSMVHERLGLEYGEVFPIMTSDPEFFELKRVS